ncbi:MAG: hypothetical protein ACO2OS_02245 [Thermosphaera aggregans]|uniref:hypothetical protein n=1 Tax=Thermosphaera aggregans TaxID=54254 RepID=UPI003C03336A
MLEYWSACLATSFSISNCLTARLYSTSCSLFTTSSPTYFAECLAEQHPYQRELPAPAIGAKWWP